MALQYFEGKQPQYVPQYNTLNPRLDYYQDASIQKQGQDVLDRQMTVMDQFGDTIDTTLNNLKGEDQQYARNYLMKTQEEMDRYVEKHGARGALPFINRKAREFTQAIQPLSQKASYVERINEALDESKASPEVISMVKQDIGDIEYGEDGRAKPFTGGINETELQTLKNWRQFEDFFSSFNSKKREPNVVEGTFSERGGGWSEASSSGEINDYRQIVESLNGTDLMLNNMTALMSDPQMRSQLKLLGKYAMKANPDRISTGSDGKIFVEEYKYRRNSNDQLIDENNEVVDNPAQASVEKFQQPYSSIEAWQAAELSKPYAERDAYKKIKYDTQKATGQKSPSEDMSESSLWTNSVQSTVPEVEASEYYSGLRNTVQDLQKSNVNAEESLHEEFQSFFNSEDDVEVTFQNGQVRVKMGTENIDEEYLAEEFSKRIEGAETKAEEYRVEKAYDRILNRMAILEVNEAHANAIEKEISSANNAVRNQLANDPEYSNIREVLSFNNSAQISFDQEKIKDFIKSGRISPVTGENMTNKLLNSSIINSMNEDDIRKVRIRESTGSKYGVPYQERETSVIKKNGEVYEVSLTGGKVGSVLYKAKRLQQEHLNKARGANEIRNTIGVTLNPKNKVHEGIIETFRHGNKGPKSTGSEYKLPDGTLLTEDDWSPTKKDYFDPVTISLIEGRPVVEGHIKESDETIKEGLQNVHLIGDEAVGMARQIYGADYENVLAAESLKSFFPKLVGEGETIHLSNTVINDILGTDFNQDFKVEFKNTVHGNSTQDEFHVYDDKGEKIFVANNRYGIIVNLLDYSQYQ